MGGGGGGGGFGWWLNFVVMIGMFVFVFDMYEDMVIRYEEQDFIFYFLLFYMEEQVEGYCQQ